MSTITLKDSLDADVVFTENGRVGNSRLFVHAGASLLDTARITIGLVEKGATNRVIAKLSVPSVGIIPSTGVSGVLWTEVGSMDLSSVRAASSEAADNFIAMFASLAGAAIIESLYTTGASA